MRVALAGLLIVASCGTEAPQREPVVDEPDARITDRTSAVDAGVARAVDARVPEAAADAALATDQAAGPDVASSGDSGAALDSRAVDGGASATDGGPAAYRICATTPKFTPGGELLALKVDATRPLRIGAGAKMIDPFPGDIDRMRLMDRVITPEEVTAHFEQRYEPCVAAQGCVAEWGFEAIEAGAFAGIGGAAQLVGQVAIVAGQDGKAARFDGTGALEVAHAPALTFSRSFSYEAWLRRGPCPPTFSGKCNMMRLFDKSDQLRLDAHAGGLRFSTTSGIYHSVPWPAQDKWTHLAISYDVRDGVRFYRNGKLQKHCPLP